MKKLIRLLTVFSAVILLITSLAACTDPSASKNTAGDQDTTAVSSEAAADKTDTAASSLSQEPETDTEKTGLLTESESTSSSVKEDCEYSTKDEVAAYIHAYGHLPPNFISKSEARDLGWNSNDGNLWDKNVAPGKSIGGDTFGNREGLLPSEKGRKYYECDINYNGGFRGAERIIFSNDGLIYYTNDHYSSFELLYE